MLVFIIVGIIAAIAAIVIGVQIRQNLPRRDQDWTGKIFRPCCRHCAYWMGLAKDGEGYCEKIMEYVPWDHCCMEYDGIDTEVKDYGVDCDDV